MSHIVVMAMGMLWRSYILVVLFSAHAAQSHKGSQGLSCLNDFVNNVSCTWNSTLMATGVDCWIIGVKKVWIIKNDIKHHSVITRSCKLKQYRNSPPGCSFVYESNEFSFYEVMPNISMECNGTLVEYLTRYKPFSHIKMRPPGVPSVNNTANETLISWSLGSPHSFLIKSLDFQVQITQKNQTWKLASNLSTQKHEIRISSWQLKGYCKVRVRVKPSDPPNSHWSNWSPTTSWMEATDVAIRRDWSLVIRGVTLSMILLVVVLGLCCTCVSSGFMHLKGKPVPNPSEYFHGLHSVHGGNLKKWLNPLSASESFFTTQPCDHISPVEVCESWDEVPSTSLSSSSTSALLHFRGYPSVGSDTSGIVDNCSTSSSWFSNVGYFMSSSSNSSARNDPSPAYFTYHDDFQHSNNSHNLHLSLCPSFTTSPAYESLKREPQSPDSGFGIGREDEEEEDKKDESGMDVEEEEVSDDHQSSPLLIFPLHLPSWMCPPSSAPPPPHPPSLTQKSSDSQQVDVPVAAASSSYAAWPVAGAMCRSSSMPVEPCKTGYLTLKELQTTFSNKSI